VEEGRWQTAELDQAEEVLITNARIGIKPVRLWKGKKLAGVGLAEELAEAFWKDGGQVRD
jgi:branched-subunit amino acid aminotransferase/4-amino-4-deoxychorismate lyase